jgi:hypothetical protein
LVQWTREKGAVIVIVFFKSFRKELAVKLSFVKELLRTPAELHLENIMFPIVSQG